MSAGERERCVLWLRGVPDRDAPASVGSYWLEQAARGAQIGGARYELGVGTTLVVSFDAIELEEAVEFARDTIAQSAIHSPALSVHIGLALGDVAVGVDAEHPAWLGSAFDRVQVLSQRARAGEIVFDENAEQRAEELFLFARELVAERVRGYGLEPIFFSKRACRAALQRLRPTPIPRSAWPVVERLRALSTQPGQQRIAIHADAAEAAADCVARLLAGEAPPLQLWIGRCAGALRPLGSLAVGLARCTTQLSAAERARWPSWLPTFLAALEQGRGVQRSEAVEALTILLSRHASAPRRPCVVLEELQEIDPATLGVVAEALMTPELDALVLMTLPVGTSVPNLLLPAGGLHQLSLPALPNEDKIAVAEAVLALEPGNDVAQRLAALSGESAHAVVEAVRTLVSAGDLVLRDERFGWRIGPRQGNALPSEALITERVAGLLPQAYRVLETIGIAPRRASRELIESVALRDGLRPEELGSGLGVLLAEGFIDEDWSLGLGDAAMRGALRNAMPPARAAELHRFVAERLRAGMPEPGFGSGELAYHLAEGGQNAEAASALIDAAHAASDAGFQRVAMRLLATAVEWDGSAPTRKAASELARNVGAASIAPSRPESPIGDDYEELKSADLALPADMAHAAMREALVALNAGDYEAVERWLDAAVAAGGGRIAAQRVLALAHLARGEQEDAIRTLSRAGSAEAGPGVRARETLAWAVVHSAGGDTQRAVRDALSALGQCRQQSDAFGTTAALRVLALIYRQLEREADALRLDAAAAASASGMNADVSPGA
jgi:tetratricopeptide (TPR) repeat protein